MISELASLHRVRVDQELIRADQFPAQFAGDLAGLVKAAVEDLRHLHRLPGLRVDHFLDRAVGLGLESPSARYRGSRPTA